MSFCLPRFNCIVATDKGKDFSGSLDITWALLGWKTQPLSVPQSLQSGIDMAWIVLLHKYLLRTLCGMCWNVTISDQLSLGTAIYTASSLEQISFATTHWYQAAHLLERMRIPEKKVSPWLPGDWY